MKNFMSAFGYASSEAGLKSTVARSAPFIAGLALSLVASAALAQSADGSTKQKRQPVAHPHREMSVARPMATGPKISVMGTLGGLNYSGTGSMSGTDTTAVPPTTTQSQSLNHTTVAGGVMMEVAPVFTPDPNGGDFGPGQNNCENDVNYCNNPWLAIFRSFFLAVGASDPGRATASFSGLSVIPNGTGTSFIKEEWSIPLYLGYRMQASRFGIAIPGLSFDVHGGVQFNEFKAGFNLVELGAGPGAPGTSASKSWWEADPAVGVGARYQLGAGWFTGVDATWAFARSQNVSAPSANFSPLESYTLATGSRTLTAVMFNLGKTF